RSTLFPYTTLSRSALLSLLEHVLAVGIDVADRREHVHVFGRTRGPEHEHDRPGDLGVLLQWLGLERNAELRQRAREHGRGPRGRGNARLGHPARGILDRRGLLRRLEHERFLLQIEL